jgi:flagellar L-ring protein precursor FlgH
MKKSTTLLLAGLTCTLFGAVEARAQSSSMFRQAGFEQPLDIRNSWTYIDIPEPRELGQHDLVTIIVSEQAQTTSESTFNRRKDANLKAELKEFIRIDDDGNLAPAALNSPTIDAQQRSRVQSDGEMEQRDAVRYTVTAMVVDVRPNGSLVLEAHKTINASGQRWEYALTGIVRRDDILPNNTVQSEKIADLRIYKDEWGKVRDSTKRGWFLRIWDVLAPI